MKKINLYIAALLILLSCAKELKSDKINIATAPPLIDYKKELYSYFKSNFKLIDSSFTNKSFQLDSLYTSIDYQFLWLTDSVSLNNDAERLIDSLLVADKYGLNSSLYNLKLIQNLKKKLIKLDNEREKYQAAAQVELLLSDSYMLFGKHLNYGTLDSINHITVLPRKEMNIDFKEYLVNAYQTKNIVEDLFELQPEHKTYKGLQLKLAYYLKNASLSTDRVSVINFRKDSVKSITQAKKALILHKYLDSISTDSLFIIALKKFQKEHGLKQDGLVGTNTAEALSKSPYRYYQTLVANLERWRWKEAFPKDYLLANIAGFNVKMYVNDEVKHSYRTVVGKYKTQTPEIKDSLLSVIAYPYWYVPKKISLEEILVKAQKDSTYFERNNFEIITYQKEPVDYDTLDWEAINDGKFNYLVRQGGGWSNSLGLVKFIFPNKNAIYLHDSPSKSLYNREKRAYSHGCVRVQNALKLADNLLKYDKNEMTIDTVKRYIEIKQEKPIRLKKRLPVYLYYFTSEIDEDNNLILYEDIYKKDRLILDQMRIINEKAIEKSKSFMHPD